MDRRALKRTTSAVYVFLAVALMSGCLDRELKPLNPCLVSGVVAEVAVTNIDKIDLLFMVDNSNSMAQEQASLRREFPRLIQVLVTGDQTGDGVADFPPAEDLHLAVVSSDLGLPSVSGITGCLGLGDEAIFNNQPGVGVTGCSVPAGGQYVPNFLSYLAENGDDPNQLAADFSCIATLGTDGCGFEQQLEAALKSVWPASDDRVMFLPDGTGWGATGQAGPGAPNGNFIRSDPSQGLSLIAIVIVTDEEDCSSAGVEHFRPTTDPLLPADSPLRMQGLNTRCFYEGQRPGSSLYTVDRYINAFKALRPGQENLVIFAGIVGVPVRLVTEEARSAFDFERPEQVAAYFDSILAAPEMQEMVDTRGTESPLDDTILPSCDRGEDARAYPPRRIVQVAKGFGANGVIQSICQEDFGPAMDAIIDVIAKQLGAVCLPRALVRNSQGLVECNVIWELPRESNGTAPLRCDHPDYPFLFTPEGRSAVGRTTGGAACTVAQMPVMGSMPAGSRTISTPNGDVTVNQGWYYDDFSRDVQVECKGTEKQRIAFSVGAEPPTGVVVKLECLNETQSLANTRTDIDDNQQQPSIGSPCRDVTLRGRQNVMGDAACVVVLNAPNDQGSREDERMFCHAGLNVCVLSCSTDADCPAAWVCDDRPGSATAAGSMDNPRPYCVNPTCGGER